LGTSQQRRGRSEERHAARWRTARLAVAGLLAVASVGCGIIVLETEDEDPDGLDPVQELDEAPPEDLEDEASDDAADDAADGEADPDADDSEG
jgi:hypothetical protein